MKKLFNVTISKTSFFSMMMILVWGAPSAHSETKKTLPIKSPVNLSFFDQVDQAIVARNIDQAEQLLRTKEKEADGQFEYSWRASRIAFLKGELSIEKKSDPKDQENYFMSAKQWSEKAIQLQPENPIGYIRRAAANGKMALFQGPLKAKDLVNQVKADCEKAISLESRTDAKTIAVAYYILARTHLKLTETPKVIRAPLGLAWGNIEDAKKNFQKSLTLNPAPLMTHLEYGKALKKSGAVDEAKKEFQIVISSPVAEVGDEARKEEAKKEM